MKHVLWLLLLAPLGAKAQVNCSPNVDAKMCSDAAQMLNPVVDHGDPYHGVAIQVEIVSPSEYEKRLRDLKDLEKRETDRIPTNCLYGTTPSDFSSCYRHNLFNTADPEITFFRHDASTGLVSSILISSARFNAYQLVAKPGSRNGESEAVRTDRYDRISVSSVASFIEGYLCGTMSVAMDGTGEPLNLSNPTTPTSNVPAAPAATEQNPADVECQAKRPGKFVTIRGKKSMCYYGSDDKMHASR